MSDTSGDAYVPDDQIDGSSSDGSTEEAICTKILVADHILACIENRELERDVEEIKCDSELLENVMSNYVIAKTIISHLTWQERIICKRVCSVWHSAVLALQKEQMQPSDFVIDMPITIPRSKVFFKQSGKFYTEPLAVLTFANMLGFSMATKCDLITPYPCTPHCSNAHCLIDVTDSNVNVPKNCMLTVAASYLTYMPLSESITYENMFTQQMFVQSNPYVSGVYIPTIPDVDFDVINIKSVANMQTDFFDAVRKLAEDRIIKGVIIYVTEIYLLQTIEDIMFVDYFKDVQPDIPFALGGCIVEDTMHDQKHIEVIVEGNNKAVDFVSENLITIAVFSVPKDSNVCNFDMYSLIVESSDWTKPKIKKTIDEFASKVPHFEHSIAIKMSCVGRDQKHKLEQEYFRAAFPNTRIVGCYGNGEMGLNHPVRPPSEVVPSGMKRHRRDPGPQFGIMYSYSSVFIYMGWGKKIPPESV